MPLSTGTALRIAGLILLIFGLYGIYSWQMKQPRVVEKIVEKPVFRVITKPVEKKQPVKKAPAPGSPEKGQPAMPKRHSGFLRNTAYKVRSQRFDSAVYHGYSVVELITLTRECTFLHFASVAPTDDTSWVTSPRRGRRDDSYLVDDQGERYGVQPSGNDWGERDLGPGEVFRYTACYERLRGNPRHFILTYQRAHVKVEIGEPVREDGDRPPGTHIPVVMGDRSESPLSRPAGAAEKPKPKRRSRTRILRPARGTLTKPSPKTLDCSQALRKYRQNQATSETVRAACPPDVAALATSEELRGQ